MSWAALAGAGAGLMGTYMQNEANSAEAARNRKFQAQQSATAHQREIQDLKSAGLNPMLSALGSGASTPGGAQASMSNLADGASTGMATAKSISEANYDKQSKEIAIDNMKDTGNNIAKDTMLKASTARNVFEDTKSKTLQNKLAEQIMPSLVKQAKASGDWSQVNQLMGVIKSGASSASDVMSLPIKIKEK